LAIRELKTEVAGTVWRVVIQAETTVAPGETVVIVESMKMEIPVVAQEAGTVLEIRVAEGAKVAEGETVALLAV
jgi:acetyl-CoA carboxylase biotin carboxyl carrier protein